MLNVTDWIKENKLGKYRLSGNQVELGCPFSDCPNQGQPQFYISTGTGAWICHRCSKKGGNLKRLELELGILKLQESVKSPHIYIPESDIEQWHDDLKANEEAMSYLKNQRGFEDWTIRQFMLGFKMYEEHPVIVIPYFDATGTCNGIKYDFYKRNAGQKYTKEKGSKTQVFNLNQIDLSKPLVITEGEYDAISGFQYGLENIASVPNGAQGINGWIEDLAAGNKFVLCFDNDAAGNEGATKLAQALGRAKCFRVYPRVKDLSEALQAGLEKERVANWFQSEEAMFTAPVTDITFYKDKAIEALHNPDIYKGVSTGWKIFDAHLGGIRMKEVTVISGKTGNGKTTFGMALVGNLMRQNMNCLVISPEMKEEKLLLELANNQFRKRVTEQDLEKFVELHGNKIRLANVYGTWTKEKEESMMDYLFDLIDYSVKYHDTKFVFLDHMRLFTSTAEEKERKEIDEFMKKCVRVAMLSNVHIMVVVQPRKLQPGQRKVTGGDLKGSANIEQDAHNILLVHREENSDIVEFDIEKNRELGTLGMFSLKFNKESMANYEEVSS